MFKSVEQGFNWMVSFTNLEKRPDITKRGYRLDKMFTLLKLCGNPHLSGNVIHVAGSKGKGSTSAFLSSILTEEGYKVGIYSSPHLLDYRERISCNHSFFSDRAYLKAINSVKKVIDNIREDLPGGEPTTFEIMTLTAFVLFKNEKCDWIVLETGIGGRLDSTNCVDPVASVITRIELEHCEILGDTLEKIAYEKAGIIKRNRPVFTSNIGREIVDVIKTRAKDKNSNLTVLDRNFSSDVDSNGTSLLINDSLYYIGLQGSIQAENAYLAMTTLKCILPRIKESSLINGLKNCSLPGRFQILGSTVLDGAHTEESVSSCIDTFKKIFGSGVIIFGAVKGKNISAMIDVVARNFKRVIISTPGSFKESNIKEIGKSFQKFANLKVDVIPEPQCAYDLAKSYNEPILVTGSFYMAGEIAKII